MAITKENLWQQYYLFYFSNVKKTYPQFGFTNYNYISIRFYKFFKYLYLHFYLTYEAHY